MRPHVGHHRSRPRQRLLTDWWPSAAGSGRPARPRAGSRSPGWSRGGRARPRRRRPRDGSVAAVCASSARTMAARRASRRCAARAPSFFAAVISGLVMRGSPGSWCTDSRGRLHPPPARRFAARRGRRGCAGACDSALDRHVVESVDVPCSGSGVVAVYHGGFFHESPPLAARHVDHDGDAVHHAPAGHVPRELAARPASRSSPSGTGRCRRCSHGRW